MSDQVSILTDEWPYSPKFQDFSRYLGMEGSRDGKGVSWSHDFRTAKKIEEIYVWAKKKAKTEDHNQVKMATYQLQKKLGVNWQGKTLVDRMWEYLRLETDVEDMKEEIKTIKHPDNRPIDEARLNGKEYQMMNKMEKLKKSLPAPTKPVKEIKQKPE